MFLDFFKRGLCVSNLDEKIKTHEERLKQLKAQKQDVITREKKKNAEQQRKDDTRRKILLGSYLLQKMENDLNKEKILAGLNQYLTEDRDRKLFNL
nr:MULTISPECIES: mobilization protein [unclassified Acinetobacter]